MMSLVIVVLAVLFLSCEQADIRLDITASETL